MVTDHKIISRSALLSWREALPEGFLVAAVPGCFDLLHPGHLALLEAAKADSDAIVVGVASDALVRQMRGEERPFNAQDDRAAVVSAIGLVDYVYIFDTMADFLAVLRPSLWVRGGDGPELMDSAERQAVELSGVKLLHVPLLAGKGTTMIAKRIARKLGIRQP
jgi:rfaE bifunctional protein nucleotidyltransferase chain/domain